MSDDPTRCVINPLAPFPKRWLDKDGQPITVLGEPTKGWLLARRPGAAPFAIQVADMLNANRRPHQFGPFTVVEKAKRIALTPTTPPNARCGESRCSVRSNERSTG